MYEDMQPVELEHEGTLLRGYAALPDGTGPFPAVLVMHTALGVTHAMNEPVARALVAEGYSAFCTDMYGVGRSYNENHGKPEKERARTVAWFDAIAARPDVDEDLRVRHPGRHLAVECLQNLELDRVVVLVEEALDPFAEL